MSWWDQIPTSPPCPSEHFRVHTKRIVACLILEVQAAFFLLSVYFLRPSHAACLWGSIKADYPPFIFFCSHTDCYGSRPAAAVATLRRFNVSLKSKIPLGQILKFPP